MLPIDRQVCDTRYLLTLLDPRQWILEITQFCPDTPIFLVGLKSDLRDDHRTIKKLKRSSQQPVSSGDVGNAINVPTSVGGRPSRAELT